MDKQTDRQTDGQTDRQTYEHTHKKTNGHTDKQTDRQTNILTNKWTEKQTDRLIPLVFEHFGRWEVKGFQYLQHLSRSSVNKESKPDAPEFLDYWRKRFAVQLQKCNSKTLTRFSTNTAAGTLQLSVDSQTHLETGTIGPFRLVIMCMCI